MDVLKNKITNNIVCQGLTTDHSFLDQHGDKSGDQTTECHHQSNRSSGAVGGESGIDSRAREGLYGHAQEGLVSPVSPATCTGQAVSVEGRAGAGHMITAVVRLQQCCHLHQEHGMERGEKIV